MLNRIIIPIFIALILIALQFIVIPFISVKFIIPNIVLIFVVLYTLRYGQISGSLFGFFIGFFFDIASAGFIGSGMFAFTLASFIAGYFHKEDYDEVIFSIKLFLPIMFLLSSLFFIIYSVLGMQSIEVQLNYSIIIYSLLCGFYTTVISLVIFLLPRDSL